MIEGSSSPNARAPRRKILAVRIAIGVVVAALFYVILQAVSINRYGFQDDGRSADCAIILGTAAWHNKPSPVFEERINHAIKLYEGGRVRALILTGGYGDGAPFSESQVALKYCLERGIPKHALLLEAKSHTTVENLAEARPLLEAHGMKSALIVSDPWHLKRGVLIARRFGIDAHASGTTTTRFRSFKARTSFLLRELWLYHVFLVFGK